MHLYLSVWHAYLSLTISFHTTTLAYDADNIFFFRYDIEKSQRVNGLKAVPCTRFLIMLIEA